MKTIALFVHQPYCSVQSDNGIIEALSPYYRFKIFTKHELEEDFFDDVDCICIPGGIGDAEKFNMCFENNQDAVKQFLRNGGKYLGICMGGYWAGSEYFDILKDCDTTQYITRPNTDTRRPHAKNLSVIWNGESKNMFFYDGFAVVGDKTKFETVASYMNGDPMAIIQNNIGIIGCHPEATKHWFVNYSWMKDKYYNHHNLLLEFVNRLMENKC
jgi:GMP synthase-like glutamine amidotransferase